MLLSKNMCHICNKKIKELNEYIKISYFNKKENLVCHIGCKEKLLYLIELICKDQDFIIEINKLTIEICYSQEKTENTENTENTEKTDKLENTEINKNFKSFCKIYKLDVLSKYIQINDPIYYILPIISAWVL